MTRDFSLFIKDILEAIDDIENFIGDMNFEAFSSDRKTRTAVVHEIEIIGEATKNIPISIRNKYKELPWQDMAKMRDKISHFYFGINYEIVWKVVKERLPEIKLAVEKILKELTKSPE
ncbi:MAG: DUF86 domain-containing protein [Nitrospiraceae bacterium]|jgi:uncharacterized protein with HEPN domain|nr:DUF86 domain-containing protein [Nitrospirota bacterium]MDA8339257.1 DUF86 domain-containing protein [Nitrospiraceae bacterium]